MKLIFLLIMTSSLIGCSLIPEQFDCKYSKGVGCKSISQVNQMLDDLALNSAIKPQPKVLVVKNQNSKSELEKVQRVVDEKLRVYIAPYQDLQGHFHEGAIIHTVLRPGFWQVDEGDFNVQ